MERFWVAGGSFRSARADFLTVDRRADVAQGHGRIPLRRRRRDRDRRRGIRGEAPELPGDLRMSATRRERTGRRRPLLLGLAALFAGCASPEARREPPLPFHVAVIPIAAEKTAAPGIAMPGAASSNPNAASSNPGAASSNPNAASLNPSAAGSNPGAAGSNTGAASSNPDAASSNPSAASSNPYAAGSNQGSATSHADTFELALDSARASRAVVKSLDGSSSRARRFSLLAG